MPSITVWASINLNSKRKLGDDGTVEDEEKGPPAFPLTFLGRETKANGVAFPKNHLLFLPRFFAFYLYKTVTKE